VGDDWQDLLGMTTGWDYQDDHENYWNERITG